MRLSSPFTPAAQRTLTAAILLLVAGLIAVFAWTSATARGYVRNLALQQESNLSLAISDEIERFIALSDRRLVTAINGLKTPGLDSLPPAARQAVLFGVAGANPLLGGILIADATGRVTYDSFSPAPMPINVSTRPQFPDATRTPGSGAVFQPADPEPD